MGKRLKLFFLAMSLCTLLQYQAYAAFSLEGTVTEKIKNHITTILKDSISGKVIVQVGHIPQNIFADFTEGSYRIKVESRFQENYTSRSIVKVMIYDDNSHTRVFGVPVSVQVFDHVLVSKQKIGRGEAITGQNVSVEWKDVSNIVKTAIRQDDLADREMITSRYIPAGRILDSRFLEAVNDVYTGSTISLIFDSQSLNVAVDGKALESGRVGDVIKVKSSQFKKNFYGQVIGKNVVKVTI